MASTTPKQHIEEIRRSKFSIGGTVNPLTEDLHQAVKNLSAELYAKDAHFLMELIQNAEDNEYLEGVDPSLEFVITSRDITRTGARATLLMFNNEKGFSPKNVDSICSVGRSTKKANRKKGYIGEKGIGFKSVFLITSRPYIFSNGYQICFSEEPCPHSNVGYIVPEWVEENPILADVKAIYGSQFALPTTTIVLPLKSDKIDAVKQQLSTMHPEVLLFLSKIKRLSVKEDNEDPKLNSVNAITMLSETNFVMRKNIDAESYMLHLSAEKSDKAESQCGYYMWKQKFPVRPENRVGGRAQLEELLITLAFPTDDRLCGGEFSPGVYAFLPTEMVTNFPFIIQADFVLASSRETMLLDNKWNQGILDCLPSAFVAAFSSLVKAVESAPVSSLPPIFRFLPVKASPYEKLNIVRDTIKVRLMKEDIIPSEPLMEQKFFHRPADVGRLMPDFWKILKCAKEGGVSLHNLSSHGKFILSSAFDSSKYEDVLNFLEVKPVSDEWYAKFIGSSNIISGVSEDLYLELLLFISRNWKSKFQWTNMGNLPLVKYVDLFGNVSLCSIYQCGSYKIMIHMSHKSSQISWLLDWNREFRCTGHLYFIPGSMQKAIQQLCSSHKEKVLQWLKDDVKVVRLNTYEYAGVLRECLGDNQNLVVAFAHFLYHSLSRKHITEDEVKDLCKTSPLLDNYRRVVRKRSGVLIPGRGSKWAALMGSNPWSSEGYVELAEDYLQPKHFAGEYTPEKQLLQFLTTYVSACDIPRISPPNSGLSVVSGPLTKQNSFLLLEWLHVMETNKIDVPKKFLKCIEEGSWLRVTLNGSPGYRPPSQSFFPTSSWGSTFQNGAVLVDIPLIDLSFYGDEIVNYKRELEMVGVMFEYSEVCVYIGKHLMALAASSSLTRSNVFSILKFIKYLREKVLPLDDFISSVNKERWLRTTCGDRSPHESVLLDDEWRIASTISDIPFIDQNFYGEEMYRFKEELKLLGVVVGFESRYELVVNYLKPAANLPLLNPEAFMLMLCCLKSCATVSKIVSLLEKIKCLKTNLGYKYPAECFLPDPKWSGLLNVFPSFPLIDVDFYGSDILSYKGEMKQLGVVMDFDAAIEAFCQTFRQRASSSSITKENVLSLLACYRQLTKRNGSVSQLRKCVTEAKWLRTRLGDYRSPKDCILYNRGWMSVSVIARLPFLDDSNSFYGKGIHQYKKELKSLGVTDEPRDGVEVVITGLSFPANLESLTRTDVLALFDCIRLYRQKKNSSLPGTFLERISQNWLKTRLGYFSPKECCLYTPEWASYLQRDDGPFIDEEYYGAHVAEYSEELNAVGVVIKPEKGCTLLVKHLDFQIDMEVISRIYSFLRDLKWVPEREAPRKIWIPNGSKQGKWACPEECILHDKDGLFSGQLHVLDKYYERNLLSFFDRAFGVKSNPSMDDYSKLWKEWEISGRQVSQADCCAFWSYVLNERTSQTEKALAESLTKLPVESNSDRVFLYEKKDVFIADDLLLKDVLEPASPRPIFAWQPLKSLPQIPRFELLKLYENIGVRRISECVQKRAVSVESRTVLKGGDSFIRKGLVRLILSFLSNPPISMEVEEKHEAVLGLLNAAVLESAEPITVSYELGLSSGDVVQGIASQTIRWDREGSKLFVKKLEKPRDKKGRIEYATHFADVIARGVLWDREEHVPALAELIKMAFLLEFNEEAVDFLLKSKNLQIYQEDTDENRYRKSYSRKKRSRRN